MSDHFPTSSQPGRHVYFEIHSQRGNWGSSSSSLHVCIHVFENKLNWNSRAFLISQLIYQWWLYHNCYYNCMHWNSEVVHFVSNHLCSFIDALLPPFVSSSTWSAVGCSKWKHNKKYLEPIESSFRNVSQDLNRYPTLVPSLKGAMEKWYEFKGYG
jgi:hypothetical protein